TELLAHFASFVVGDDSHRPCPGNRSQLDGLGAESTGSTPHEHDVVGTDLVAGPSVQHSIGGGANERWGSGLLPREMRSLGKDLMSLGDAELPEGTEVGVVPPDRSRWGNHRVLARRHPWIRGIPPPRMRDHLITHFDAG